MYFEAELHVDGRRVARAEIADTWARRARGLLGRRVLPEALVLLPERSVHGLGMREPLDVALLDARGTVLAVHVLRPGGFTRSHRGTTHVLEAPRGSFARWGLAVDATVDLVGRTPGGATRSGGTP